MESNFKDWRPNFNGCWSFFKIWWLLFFLLCLLLWYSTKLLIVVAPENYSVPLVIDTYPNDKFTIKLTHSVEKTNWEDCFIINTANDITLQTSKFQSLGWGYPYSTVDGKLNMSDDGYFILAMNRSYQKIALRISAQAMQQFTHQQQVYDLVTLYGDGTAVLIQVQYRYQYWLNNLKFLERSWS